MSFSVKIRYEGQFYKPGRLDLTSLASLDAFVREFLRTRAVANAASAQLALRYRDAAGDWQSLRDESDLVAATQQQDDSKIVIEVVVQPAESVSDDAAIAAAVAAATAVDDDDDATTTDSTTPTTPTEESDANKKAQCRAMCKKRGRRCVVFWLIVVGILLWCGFGSGCHKKREAERAAAEQVSPAVRFLHIPPNFPAPDTQRFHDLAVLHFKQQQGLVVMSPADKRELSVLASSAATMFEENHRNALKFQQEVEAKVNEINRLSAVIANLQEHLAAHQHKESVLHVVVQRQAEELRQFSAQNEQLQAQLARASQQQQQQQQQKQSAADAQTAPHADSLSNLFLDVSRKLGQLATNQMDELSQKHLGKPLEDLLDGSAVRKTLFDTLTALNNKLENHQQSTSQVIRQRMLREQQEREQQEREQQRRQAQELQQRRQEQHRQEQLRQEQLRQEQLRQEQLRQEQLRQEQLQRQERQRIRIAEERQRQLEVQREHQRIRDHQRAEAERIEREHRESQAWRHKRTNQPLDDDDDAVSAKWHAKRLHERTKAAKRAMRELHNEL
jgi:hypothetical protein